MVEDCPCQTPISLRIVTVLPVCFDISARTESSEALVTCSVTSDGSGESADGGVGDVVGVSAMQGEAAMRPIRMKSNRFIYFSRQREIVKGDRHVDHRHLRWNIEHQVVGRQAVAAVILG